MSPFLNNGITIDSVHPSGNIPLSNKVLKNFTKKWATWLPDYLIISPIIPSGPGTFLSLIFLSASKTSASDTGRFKV